MFMLRRAATSVALLSISVVLPIASVAAAVQAAGAAGSQSVSSGTWGVVPTQSTSAPPPTGPLTLSATTNAAQYFKVVNTGNVSLAGMSYVVTISGGTKTALALTACSVAWTQGGAGSCSGTLTPIATWSEQSPLPNGDATNGSTVASTTVPVTAGATLFLRATPTNAVGGAGNTFTITTTVKSASTRQIRAAMTTNA